MSKIIEEFDQIIIPCNTCKWHLSGLICAAFPNGIPDEILFGDNEHLEPLPNQGNDFIYKKDRTL